MPFYSIAPGCLLVEAANAAAFPATGAANTIYIAQDTNTLYRWTGSAYVVVSASPEEVIEAANLAAFPATGETGKLYVAIDTGLAYRWTGSVYVEISAAPVTSVAGKTGVVTLAIGDVGGLQTALDGKQASGSYAAASHSHDAATTSAAGFLSAADKSKLDGIAAGATANATDAQLRDRSTHTGTQSASTITGLAAIAASGSANDLAAGTVPIARIPTGNTSSTVCIGNDARLSDTRTPSDGTVTDAKIASAGLSTSSLNWAAIQPWAANTAYAKGDLVSFQGIAYRRSTAGASGATFNVANWQQITPSEFVASQITSGTIAAARLGSGTADATTYLRGDSTFAPAVTSVDGSTGAVTVTKAQVFEFTRTSKPASATGSSGSYSWTLPSGAKLVEVLMIGGGAGGGSGRRGASGTIRYGGGGGGSGGTIHTTFPASLVTTAIAVVVGTGGAGGAAVTSDDTNGNPGTSGGSSTITFSGSPTACFTGWFGLNGLGGTAASGTGGSFVSNGISTYRGNSGQSASLSTLGSLPNIQAANGNIVVSGAAGGSLDTSSNAYAAGTVVPQATMLASAAQLGASVSGGAASLTGGTAGANAVAFGYGGCGGGASANGFASGAGGNGGDGYVRITVWS